MTDPRSLKDDGIMVIDRSNPGDSGFIIETKNKIVAVKGITVSKHKEVTLW